MRKINFLLLVILYTGTIQAQTNFTTNPLNTNEGNNQNSQLSGRFILVDEEQDFPHSSEFQQLERNSRIYSGLAVCPGMGNLTANPANASCYGSPVSMTAAGLTSMGSTYGIDFIESATPLADPYSGGILIGSVVNGSLTSGGTVASITTSSLSSGVHYIYAILSPVPADPSCRPSAQTSFVVNPNPTVNAIANQGVCNGSNTAAVNFTGTPALSATAAYSVSSFDNKLYTIPLTNFQATSEVVTSMAGFTVQGINSIAYDPSSKQYYVVVKVSSSSTARRLGTINPSTGVITDLGSLGDRFSSITFAPDGRLWGVTGNGASVSQSLFSINKATAATTLIRALGNGADGEIILFNPADNFLYHWSGNVVVVYEKLDVATYTITPIGSYNSGIGSGEVFGASVDPSTGDFILNDISSNVKRWNAAGPVSQLGSTRNMASVLTDMRGMAFTPGVSYNWTNNNTSIGLGASGSGNITSFAGANPGNTPNVATITVTPSYTSNGQTCNGTPQTFTITVNPIPTVAAITNQTVCNNSSTGTITFSGAVLGTVYSWANNNTSIGLGASGTGNIASFVATNSGTVPVTATITITPSFTNAGVTCTGTPTTFTITVNPTPTVNAVANQTLCNNSSTTAISFAGTVPGTVYNWTNNTTSIGLAASGSGNIASFVATNTTNAPGIATITVTPSYTNGSVTCNGTPRTFTITVNPTPTVNPVTNQNVCAGSATTAITFSGAVTGTVFNWTNNTTSIGLAASGSGNIPAFVATNATTSPVTATITVTPSYTNGSVTCTGSPVTFTITVNPAPTVTCPANITVNAAAGTCGAVVTYAATATGTPVPTITYSIPSGSTFPVGLTTVNVTATSACGTATCSFTVRVNDVQVPVITTQPVSKGFCSGTNATFTVVSTNAASYQWQQWNGTAWVNITGATSATLTIPGATPSMSTNTFRVIVTGPCGSTATSNPATLTVFNPPTVSILAAPPSILPNQTATLTAIVNNGIGSFVWSYNGTVIGGSTGQSIGPLFATAAGTYRVVYTDPNGCVATSADQTLTAIITDMVLVYPNPNAGQFDVRYYNAANEKATINVYNSLGQRIYSKAFTTAAPYTQMDIDLGFKANGIYSVEVVDGAGNIKGSKKIMVNTK